RTETIEQLTQFGRGQGDRYGGQSKRGRYGFTAPPTLSADGAKKDGESEDDKRAESGHHAEKCSHNHGPTRLGLLHARSHPFPSRAEGSSHPLKQLSRGYVRTLALYPSSATIGARSR